MDAPGRIRMVRWMVYHLVDSCLALHAGDKRYDH